MFFSKCPICGYPHDDGTLYDIDGVTYFICFNCDESISKEEIEKKLIPMAATHKFDVSEEQIKQYYGYYSNGMSVDYKKEIKNNILQIYSKKTPDMKYSIDLNNAVEWKTDYISDVEIGSISYSYGEKKRRELLFGVDMMNPTVINFIGMRDVN